MIRPRVFTWHVHGSYLYYLSHADVDFILPYNDDRSPGYAGRTSSFPWPDNVKEVHVGALPNTAFDCILFQSHAHYLTDQHSILTEAQRQLPKVFLEHDPPREHPTDTRHPVDDPDMLLVHCTHFNNLMWDGGRTPTTVIEHGVVVPDDARYTGDLRRGIVVVNNLKLRGRRLGSDIWLRARERAPLDLVGMNSTEIGGLGEIPPTELPRFQASYRFFFNPIRYTSLGLAILEAMMIGLPIVGLATTELVSVIENGVSGYVDTNEDTLVSHLQRLLDDADHARQLGARAREIAVSRFNIQRFAREWTRTLNDVAASRQGQPNIQPISTSVVGTSSLRYAS